MVDEELVWDERTDLYVGLDWVERPDWGKRQVSLFCLTADDSV